MSRGIKKAKKSFCPRASTGSTQLELRYAGSKPFSNANITKCNIMTPELLQNVIFSAYRRDKSNTIFNTLYKTPTETKGYAKACHLLVWAISVSNYFMGIFMGILPIYGYLWVILWV